MDNDPRSSAQSAFAVQARRNLRLPFNGGQSAFVA
jgi:hypothetical protein